MLNQHIYCVILISCLFNIYFANGQNLTETYTTVSVNNTAAINTSNVRQCPEGYKQSPSCLECESNYELKDNQCLLKQNETKPMSAFRRFLLLSLGGLLTIFLLFALFVTYNHLIKQNPHNTTTNSNPLNRFNDTLRSIRLNNINKIPRFPFFSTSNNNGSSGHHRQGETSRSHLSENQDEALLFDDPYADGGLSGGIHGSSANPYKSLTLSVT